MSDIICAFYVTTKPDSSKEYSVWQVAPGLQVFVRMARFRGGSDPLDWAARNAQPNEMLLNTYELEAHNGND